MRRSEKSTGTTTKSARVKMCNWGHRVAELSVLPMVYETSNGVVAVFVVVLCM
jgi:hypothetical protein